MGWVHNREYYRIAYPAALRPKLLVQGHTFDVVDICERGIRFRLGEAGAPDVGLELEGTVRFRRGETVTVRGAILRVNQDEVAARLDAGVPLRAIMDEQRFLLDRRRHLGL
ncbi:MAG TPA: PilZ domain-containing protein [Gemmatimonadales bacterium]|nr:PilZ domain-containing protein [Gemmatimonadales bacterium]